MATEAVSQPATDMESLYAQRFQRYVTALRNEQPDRVPIRPFVAEFTGRYAGYTCQELAHDYEKAFDAARRCAAAFDWDAVVSNMVYVWTGLTQAIGLKYYGIPGIDIPADRGFQYVEPPEDNAFMRAEEYDQLIEDPTGFLFNVWLPRVASPVSAPGEPASYASHLALVKGGMAMMQYFGAFDEQNRRLREESGTVSAIAGILKAPMDILADKLRGYLGLLDDLREQPEKVLAACEALMPHLTHVARSTADMDKNVPIGLWMHRGCVPLVSPQHFDTIYWPTLKPIIQELWASGHQTLFYAEGNWDYHLASFAELPDCSIVYHVDQGDIFAAHRVLGEKFCLSGGIPNALLGFGTADEIRQRCKKVIDGVAGNGGYIMDASAIIQNDATVENIRAMTEATLEYGVYSSAGASSAVAPAPLDKDTTPGRFIRSSMDTLVAPGECIPWSVKRQEIEAIPGDEQLCQDVWQSIEGLGYMFIWQCLLSF